MIIREKEDKRTLEQNARLWKLYTSIGDYLGYTKDELHALMGYKFLRFQREIAGEVIEDIESTTKLDTEKMAWYQQQVEFWASQMGWGGLDG